MASITINNETLRNTFYYVITIQNALDKEFDKVQGNKSHLDKLVPEFLVGIYSQKLDKALGFKDNITQTAYNSAIILLVATFEKVVFAKYRTACGNFRKVLQDHTAKTIDYYKSREQFINSSIDKLAVIIELISGHLDNALLIELNNIKDHRNFLAHGQRDRTAPTVELPINVVAKTLDDVITEIEEKKIIS